MPSESALLPPAVAAAAGLILLASLVLATWRAVRGPHIADRVMALDLVAAVLMGACILLAMISGRELFLDVALAVAVIAFIGTISFARQIEFEAAQRQRPEGRDS
jgi:multicomponent Na+:H+ antiporter subunit F